VTMRVRESVRSVFLLRVDHELRAMELVWERRVGVWDNTRYHQEMLGLTIRTTCDPGPHLGEWEDASRYYRHGEEPEVTAPFSGSWKAIGLACRDSFVSRHTRVRLASPCDH
jgi:hypothetical protein